MRFDEYLLMSFEIANIHQFPFPVQQNEPVVIMTISRIFEKKITGLIFYPFFMQKAVHKHSQKCVMKQKSIYVSKFQIKENLSDSTGKCIIHLTNPVKKNGKKRKRMKKLEN